MTARKAAQVYSLGEAERDVHAVVRYSGDPDEFAALAHHWLATQMNGTWVYPVALAAPEPRLWRWNPTPHGEYPLALTEQRAARRGTWLGSLLRVVKIGCSQCQYLHGAHHPGGCLNADIVALQTCQMSGKSLGRRTEEAIHLVRARGRTPERLAGTPGPTLCDVDRFGPGISFSMGGGYTAGMPARACWSCVTSAQIDFPGRPVTTSMREFAQAFVDAGLPVSRNWAVRLTPTPGSNGFLAAKKQLVAV